MSFAVEMQRSYILTVMKGKVGCSILWKLESVEWICPAKFYIHLRLQLETDFLSAVSCCYSRDLSGGKEQVPRPTYTSYLEI
jgi:hypothetical protein